MRILGRDIVLREKIEVESSDIAVVSGDGQYLINQALRKHDMCGLPDWFDMSMEVGTRITKRISKHCHDVDGVNLPKSALEQIGNIAKKHSQTYSDVRIDFTDKFNWQDGNFADGGSCFWGCYNSTRPIMEDEGFLAVRLWDSVSAGIGRAWLKPLDDNMLIAFNGYGRYGLLGAVLTMMSVFDNVRYKRIGLLNHGVWDRALYINGGAGYVMTVEKGRIFASHDFMIDAVFPKCHFCKTVMIGGAHRDGRMDGIVVKICKPCSTTIKKCCHCSEIAMKDAEGWKRHGQNYCPKCYKICCKPCVKCGEMTWQENGMMMDEGLLCSTCFHRVYKKCASCDRWRSGVKKFFKRASAGSKRYVCDYCARHRFYGECEECGGLKTLRSNRENKLCRWCQRERREREREEREASDDCEYAPPNDSVMRPSGTIHWGLPSTYAQEEEPSIDIGAGFAESARRFSEQIRHIGGFSLPRFAGRITAQDEPRVAARRATESFLDEPTDEGPVCDEPQ